MLLDKGQDPYLLQDLGELNSLQCDCIQSLSIRTEHLEPDPELVLKLPHHLILILRELKSHASPPVRALVNDCESPWVLGGFEFPHALDGVVLLEVGGVVVLVRGVLGLTGELVLVLLPGFAGGLS